MDEHSQASSFSLRWPADQKIKACALAQGAWESSLRRASLVAEARLSSALISSNMPSGAAGRGILVGNCIAGCHVASIFLAIRRCVVPCASARGEAGTTTADTGCRSYCCRSLPRQAIATVAAAASCARRTVTGTCCTEEDGRSDKRLIEEAGHIFSAAQGAGSGEVSFRPASRSMILPDLWSLPRGMHPSKAVRIASAP
jgi:hypothetical protein